MPTHPFPSLALLCLALAPWTTARAQTDYYNTDAHHPFVTADAVALERHAFELRLVPLSLERRDDGAYVWTLAPALAYGVLPRTHLELTSAFAWSDPGAIGTRGALAGLDLSVLHQLQLERERVPAVAIGAEVVAPVGGLAHDQWLSTLKLMATRTFHVARLHLNGAYTLGPSDGATGVRHASRWMAGMAVDRAWPLSSLLAGVEVSASEPMGVDASDPHPPVVGEPDTDIAWRAGGGVRWQWSPRLTIDAGIARTASGPHRGWELTLGLSRSFGIRSLIPVPAPDERPSGPGILHEQFYLPASHNWRFRARYAGADRMFNAFDYGHAILYETLLTRRGAPAALLEDEEYTRITTRILAAPPRLPLEEGAIEIGYAKLVPEAKAMFEWAHVLHRQLYDVWADERIPVAEKDARVAELLRYYRSRPDLAFSSVPKNMELMEGQSYSLAFRRSYPKFNGLIWAYHWLQIGLYDALIAGATPTDRQANVSLAVGRFWQMLAAPPEHLPRLMPMGPAVAPLFSARYPEAAIIFDNLHSMHDVVSDILASTQVPPERKRAAIIEAAGRYRDDVSFTMTREEWWSMAISMGAHNMGGPSTGFSGPLPTPTVPLGAPHAGEHHHAAPSRP